MIALLGALAVALLLILQPWAPASVAPHSLGLVPGAGGGQSSVTTAPSRALAVGPARSLAGTEARLVSASTGTGTGDSDPVAGIARARALTFPAGGPPLEAPPQAQAPETPVANPPPAPVVAPESTAVPVAAPVTAPGPEPVSPPAEVPGPPAGPITSGSGSIGGSAEPIEVREGGEYALAFSFYVLPTAYRAPGAESSILSLAAPREAPTFGLQLWDDGAGQRGLWSSGEAMGGERFLAPLVEGAWHRLVAYFVAGAPEEGLYLLVLDGRPIDTRAWVSLLRPAGSGQLTVGLQREGESILTAPDVLFGPVELGESLESVLP